MASIWPFVFQNDLGTLEPTYRLIPIVDHCVEVRRKAQKILASQSDAVDHEPVENLLKTVKASVLALTAWNDNLSEEYEGNDNYWMLFTKNLYRCHRVFLQDMIARCCHILRFLNPCLYDPQIAACVETASLLVDDICAAMPYDFGNSSPETGHMDGRRKAIASTKATIIFHLSFTQVSFYVKIAELTFGLGFPSSYLAWCSSDLKNRVKV